MAEKLDELGFDNAIVTRDPEIYKELLKQKAFVVQEKENHPIMALKEAGLDKASIIIAAQDEDSRNLLIILAVRKMRPDIRIVSVINDQDLIETAKTAGADAVIPASITVGRLLALSAVTKIWSGWYIPKRLERRNRRILGLQDVQADREGSARGIEIRNDHRSCAGRCCGNIHFRPILHYQGK